MKHLGAVVRVFKANKDWMVYTCLKRQTATWSTQWWQCVAWPCRRRHRGWRVIQQMLAVRQARGADGGLLTVLLACRFVLGALAARLPARLCAALLPEVLVSCLHRMLGDGRDVDDASSAPLLASAPLRIADLPCAESARRRSWRAHAQARGAAGRRDALRRAAVLCARHAPRVRFERWRDSSATKRAGARSAPRTWSTVAHVGAGS